MSEFELITGDALEVLRQAQDGQVRCVVTSPPYYGLRDYGTGQWEGGKPDCKHRFANPQRTSAADGSFSEVRGEQKKVESARPMLHECRWCGAKRIDSQIGLEASVDLYVQRLVEVFRELRRVLTDDGTLWLNLGDSYITRPGQGTRGKATKKSSTLSGGVGNDGGSAVLGATKNQQNQASRSAMYRFRDESSHGLKHKDLIGVPWRVALALQADGWWLRDDIIWDKPNPLPESVRDRPTRAHEYLFMLSKSQSYYYDYEAMQEPAVVGNHARTVINNGPEVTPPGTSPHRGLRVYNLRKNATPEIAEASPSLARRVGGFQDRWDSKEQKATRNRRDVWRIASEPYKGSHYAVMPTKLVEPCVLAGSAPGDLIMDPFFGSGTVGAVAVRHGRNFIGIDLDARNVALANARISEEYVTQELGRTA